MTILPESINRQDVMSPASGHDEGRSVTPCIDVFFAEMATDDASHQHHWKLLNADERERADRFHFQRDRRMFVACRATLRTLLATYTGVSAQSLKFEFGSHGKPSLPHTGISFNVSHAGSWFACATSVSSGARTDAAIDIGIDIEHMHPLPGLHAMAQHFFAPAEVERLAEIPENVRIRSFFECWTRKEAVIKATGEGVSRPLDSFEVAFGPDTEPALLRLDQQRNPGWGMHTFDPAPDYVAALTSPNYCLGRQSFHLPSSTSS